MVAVEALKEAARSELRRLVQEEAVDFPGIDWVWQALRARGKILVEEDGFSWGTLPLLVCQDAGGDPRLALPLSAALECFIAALDTFDDIQDADAAEALWRTGGISTASNVATFLLFLSQLGLSRIARGGVSDGLVAEIVRTFAAAGARACGGQQRDLDQMTGQAVDESRYLAMIAQKSAGLVECACRTAAILGAGGTNRPAIEAFAQFGRHLGMVMQITNDVAGASSASEDRNDLRTGKRTLPLIFALECAPAPIQDELAGIFRPGRQGDLSPEEADRLRPVLASTGALHYASTVADVYWERALGCLARAGCGNGSLLLALVAQMRGDV
jgi:geranylgeranyl diphosphate synthase, type I